MPRGVEGSHLGLVRCHFCRDVGHLLHLLLLPPEGLDPSAQLRILPQQQLGSLLVLHAASQKDVHYLMLPLSRTRDHLLGYFLYDRLPPHGHLIHSHIRGGHWTVGFGRCWRGGYHFWCGPLTPRNFPCRGSRTSLPNRTWSSRRSCEHHR